MTTATDTKSAQEARKRFAGVDRQAAELLDQADYFRELGNGPAADIFEDRAYQILENVPEGAETER
jgi:hypothetical protein